MQRRKFWQVFVREVNVLLTFHTKLRINNVFYSMMFEKKWFLAVSSICENTYTISVKKLKKLNFKALKGRYLLG